MKKVLLSVTFLGATFLGVKAQETISFETSEGYVLGNINGQNGWSVTGNGQGGFISNQEVSDDVASHGSYSFKIASDSDYGYQQNPLMGGIYDLSSPLPFNFVKASIYIVDEIGNASDYRFGTVNLTDQVYNSIIQFRFNGEIAVLDSGQFAIISQTWTPSTSYDVEIALSGTDLIYSINAEVVHTANGVTPGNIEQVRFVHDNYNIDTGGVAYIDNIGINQEPFTVAVEDFATASFSVFPNPATDVIHISNGVDAIENVKVTDLNGRVVKESSLVVDQAQINISDLAQGVYILNATSNGKTITEKIVKK